MLTQIPYNSANHMANMKKVVMITPVAFQNIQWKTYLIFAIINALMVPSVYFFFPETAYRSLEEMDSIFHQVKGWKGALDVIGVARDMPRRYGKNGELLIPIEDEKAHTEHHNGSSDGGSADNGMFTKNDEETVRKQEQS